jgi:hypothetical protein
MVAAGLATAAAAIPTDYPTGPGPMNIVVGSDGRLIYQPDTNGDTIPDISNCGYGGGGVPIPTNIPVVMTLNPVAGDNLAQIQNAINTVGTMPVGPNGFRGAILLKAGLYPVSSSVTINKSGIVLRGEGSGPGGTVLEMTGGNITILVMDNGGTGASQVSGTQHNLTDSYVPVGAKWFRVDATNGLAVGDTIKVVRVCTAAWLAVINQTNWSASAFYVKWDRVITEMDGNRIAIDAPITQGIDVNYGGGYVYKYSFPARLTNCAFEDIRGICNVNVSTNGTTDGNFITLKNVMNCWVRRCENFQMRGHSSDVSGDSKWVTFEDLVSYHTYIPNHSGSSIQINTYDGLTLALYHRVTTSDGGFEFSSGGLTPGPNAVVECEIPHGFAATSPHMKWAVATFYDALYMNQSLSVQDQGLNTSHGWAAANQVAWNVETAAALNFDRPQTAHQMIIGSIGTFNGNRTGTLPPEIISKNAHVLPRSLYRQQLRERVGSPATFTALGAPYGDDYFVVNSATNSLTVTPGLSVTNAVVMTVKVTTPYTDLSMYPANFYTNYPGSNVTFSVTGLPPGATASFNPPTLNANGTTALTITAGSSTPSGSYPLVIQGVGVFKTLTGGTSALTNFDALTLNVGGAVNFSVAASPPSETVVVGSNTTYSVTVTPSNGYTNDVVLSANGLPDHVGAAFNPPSVPGTGTSTLTITASNGAPIDAFTLTIVGVSLDSSAATTAGLSIVPAPGTLPSPWLDVDFAGTTPAGQGTYSNGVFIVQGGGADFGGAADEGNFVFEPVDGNMTFTARVLGEGNSGGGLAKAGLMIRESTNFDASFAAVFVSPGAGVVMEYRSATGTGAAEIAGPNVTAPCWLKLVRAGDLFTGFSSPDGSNWTQIGSVTFSMIVSVAAGLAISSHDAAQLNTSLFDSVTLGFPDFLVAIAPVSQSVNAGLGTVFTVNIVATNGFTGVVALAEDDDLTPDASAVLSTNLVTVPGSATITVSTTTATPVNGYSLSVNAVSGLLSHNASATLTIANTLPAGLWTGASGEEVDWSDGENWGNGLFPGPADNVKFYDLGATNAAGAINNVVDANLTINSLQSGQTNGSHATLIAPGVTLTVTGNTGANGYSLFAGTASDNGSNQAVTAAITGAGGALVISNSTGSVNFSQGAAASVSQRATLDMSGLDQFSATVANFYVGNQPANNAANPGRPTATVALAKTNTVILAPAGLLLLSQAASDGTTTGNILWLGQTNAFFGNTNITSGGKGGVGNRIQFNPAFLGAGPAAWFRGAGGNNSRVLLWAIGFASAGSANNDSAGTNDFTGGTVDALVDLMIVGRGQAANNAGRMGAGTLTFDSGSINVNTIQAGFQVPNNSSAGVGTINVNGSARLTINNALGLGLTGTSVNAASRGLLNINGGTVFANSITNGGSTASAVTVTAGSLVISNTIGTPAAPLPLLNVTNALLHLRVNEASPITNISVGTVSAGGTTTITIDAVQNPGGPTVVPLISYNSLAGSVAGNFVVALPAGFSGGLIDNAAQKRIDLNVSVTPLAPPRITGLNVSGGNIVLAGTNGPLSGNYYLLSSTNLALPLSNWTRLATNAFDSGGAFNVTNPVDPHDGQRYYRLQLP